MSYMVLWLDHENAKLFNFKSANPDVKHIANKHHVNHHNSARQENEKQEQLKKFYHDIHEELLQARGILIVGPGLAKTEFKHYLDSHHPKALSLAVLAVEPMDKATDGEITNLAKKFFHKYNLFH